MNIYFSCSITGGRNEEKTYQEIVKFLLSKGHEVPTAHLSESSVMEVEKTADPETIFTRDMKWLKDCDLVIAEVTSPSHGVGYEIAYALTLGKPVLCCYKQGKKVSKIITGNTEKNLTVKVYETDAEVVEVINDYIAIFDQHGQEFLNKKITRDEPLQQMETGKIKHSRIQRFLAKPKVQPYLFVLILLLGIAGQIALKAERNWITLFCFWEAILLLSILRPAYQFDDIKVDLSPKNYLSSFPILASFGVVLTLVATWLTLQPDIPLKLGLFALGVWLVGVSLFGIGVMIKVNWVSLTLKDLKTWFIDHKTEIITVSIIVLAGFLMRIIGIGSFPASVANDETKIAFEALRINKGEWHNFFSVAGDAFPMLSFLPRSLALFIFGNNAFAVRVVSSLEGTFTLLFLYLFAKEAFGKRIALFSLIILTTLPVHLHYSRIGLNNIQMGLHTTLIFWLLLRAVRTGKSVTYLWAGLMTGSALYAYSGSRLVMVISVLCLILICFFRPGYFKANWQKILIFGGGIFVVAIPMIGFYLKQPDLMNARLNTVGIFRNDWLSNQAHNLGKTEFGVILEQIRLSFSIFALDGESTGFFTSPYPIFNFIEAIFFLLGLGLSILRIYKPIHLIVQLLFWGNVLIGGAMTVPTPQTTRMLLALPVTVIFISIALDYCVGALQNLKPSTPKLAMVIGFLCVGGFALSGFISYFFDYRNGGYFCGPTEEFEVNSIALEKSLGKEYQYILIGAPRVFLEFSDYKVFLDGYDVQEIMSETDSTVFSDGSLFENKATGELVQPELASIKNILPSFFVSIPERKAELIRISQLYPGGTMFRVNRTYRPSEVLYYGYIYPSTEIVLPEKAVIIE